MEVRGEFDEALTQGAPSPVIAVAGHHIEMRVVGDNALSRHPDAATTLVSRRAVGVVQRQGVVIKTQHPAIEGTSVIKRGKGRVDLALEV